MWISKAHFDLIAQRAKEFREWHETRMADRDVTIAQLERRIETLDQERRELVAKLLAREEQRNKPPEALPEPTAKDWDSILRLQTEEMNTEEAPDADA